MHGKFSQAHWPIVAGLGIVLFFCGLVEGAQPRIDHISILNNDLVAIHVYAEQPGAYVLQSIPRLTCGTNTAICGPRGIPTNWSNISTGYAFAAGDHFVFGDSRAPARRFYRLKVTPF